MADNSPAHIGWHINTSTSRIEDEIVIGGRKYRRFLDPRGVQHPFDDGTLRCIRCGQIDDEPYHDSDLCRSDIWQGVVRQVAEYDLPEPTLDHPDDIAAQNAFLLKGVYGEPGKGKTAGPVTFKGATEAASYSDEWLVLPGDFWSHLVDWRTACEQMRSDASTGDDISYWTKQLTTLDKCKAALGGLEPLRVVGRDDPTPLCRDEGCDHHGTEHVCIEQPLAATGIGSVPWYAAAERAEFQFLANTISEAIEHAKPANMSSWRVAEKIALRYAKDGSFFERFKP